MVTTACWSKANVELRTIDGRDIGSKLCDLGCTYAEEANKGERAVHTRACHPWFWKPQLWRLAWDTVCQHVHLNHQCNVGTFSAQLLCSRMPLSDNATSEYYGWTYHICPGSDQALLFSCERDQFNIAAEGNPGLLDAPVQYWELRLFPSHRRFRQVPIAYMHSMCQRAQPKVSVDVWTCPLWAKWATWVIVSRNEDNFQHICRGIVSTVYASDKCAIKTERLTRSHLVQSPPRMPLTCMLHRFARTVAWSTWQQPSNLCEDARLSIFVSKEVNTLVQQLHLWCLQRAGRSEAMQGGHEHISQWLLGRGGTIPVMQRSKLLSRNREDTRSHCKHFSMFHDKTL